MKKQLLLLLAFTTVFAVNAQVTLVKEINDSGTSSSNPAYLFVFNNKIYFAADDSNGSNTPGGLDLGKELWVTDGTETGTTFVADLRPGSDSSSPKDFFEFNSTMYFIASDGVATGTVLFSSDGTEAGTTATGGTFVFNPIELNGLIYYIATSDSNSLYEFNGTTQVKVANVGTEDVNFLGAQFTVFNDKILGYGFTATDDPTIGIELYEYDPATDTYTLIKDITGDDANAGISNFTVLGNELYFEALDRLWKTDGTESGTIAIAPADIFKGTKALFAFDGKILFEGDVADESNSDAGGDNLIAYDPATNTVTNISKFTGNSENHDPSDYAVLGDYLYYRGEEAATTTGHLYRTNGVTTELITNTIKDIDDLAVLNGKLYFEGDDGISGNELYSLDPTTLAVGDNKLEIISVYPNPASDYLMVPNNLIGATYAIYDITGKVLKEGSIDSEKINLDLNSGIYMFKVETELSTVTKKIIVE